MSATPSDDLVERLVRHRALGEAPRQELEWLASRGSLQSYDTGAVVNHANQPVEKLYVLLSGQLAIFVDRGAGRHKIMEWKAGDVTGMLPYSRMQSTPGDMVAEEPTSVLAVGQEHHPEMIREFHRLTSILFHEMLDRARVFTSSALHDEKLISLGKLSAGLAHELNNPASAIERGALLLRERLEDAEEGARILGGARLSDEQLVALDAAREACASESPRGVRSPLEQAMREEKLAEWLEDQGLEGASAEALAESSISMEILHRLADVVDGPALVAGLRWLVGCCSVRSLSEDLHRASLRISELVAAVKGFTHMDQAAVARPVDLAEGLDDTVTVLRSKARAKSVTVDVQVPSDLPLVWGFAGELNQVLANLIDNAIDAVPEGGRVEVRADREEDRLAVRVIDDGPGIPEEIREHIFEPFFTTKGVGEGTGLGLDIVRRLVIHNDGEIAVDSEPGRTEFQIFLPLAESMETS